MHRDALCSLAFEAHRLLLEERFQGHVAKPALVDNLAPAVIFPGRDQQTFLFPVRRNDSADTMTGAVVFFSKSLLRGGDGGLGDRRFYSRVHD